MKMIKRTLLVMMLLIVGIFTTGCWDYREVNQVLIVGGIAVDKGTEGKYKITAETLKISGGKDTKTTSKTVTMEGKTMFDTARNAIEISGKRLYWNHSKVIILSKEIAKEGVTKVIDWYNRDAEAREDVYILISEQPTANEIFEGESTTEDIKSFSLGYIIKNEVSLSKAPITDILEFDIESQMKGMSGIIPTVALKKIGEVTVPQITGAAIIKNDKLIGTLDGEETKYLNFIRDEVEGGVLTEEIQTNDVPTPISFEIFDSKTKVKPVVDDKEIKMNINVDMVVAIDEIGGTGNFFDMEGQQKLEDAIESKLEEQIQSLVKKVQSEYDADIFMFGAKLYEDKVKVWKSINDNWDDVFKDLKVDVKANVHIKNSGVLSKTFEVGE